MREDCGCCEGTEELTPRGVANHPGLDALAYRVGTHASFLETMKARLSALQLPDEDFDPQGQPRRKARRPLARLTTRQPDDASVAMLDAWATVADVLTFYQERIANEGYLRTATERRSVLELARLIGYEPHNGVASSVYLAFTLDAGTGQEIPAGTRAQSVPGPGELLESFETAEPLPARGEWNTLRPRVTRPQNFMDRSAVRVLSYINLKGTSTNLSVGDALLVIVGSARTIYRVLAVEADTAADRTLVRLSRWTRAGAAPPAQSFRTHPLSRLHDALDTIFAQVGTDVDSKLKTVGTVSDILTALKNELNNKNAGEILLMLEEEIIPSLRKIVSQPAVMRSSNLRAWLAAVIEELESIAGSLTAVPAHETIDLNELFDEKGVFQMPSSVTAQSIFDTSGTAAVKPVPTIDIVGTMAEQLVRPASKPPSSSAHLERSVGKSLTAASHAIPRLLAAFRPELAQNLFRALENAPVTLPPPVQVFAMRTRAKLFGSTAPQRTRLTPITNGDAGPPVAFDTEHIEWTPAADEGNNTLFLDNAYDKILPGGYVAVLRPDRDAPSVYVGRDSAVRARSAYGVSGDTTLVTLDTNWWRPHATQSNGTSTPADPPANPPTSSASYDAVRGTTVFAQSEPLEVAEDPITEELCGQSIELDGVYDGLEPGRWLVITGERSDVAVEAKPRTPPAPAGGGAAPAGTGTGTGAPTDMAEPLPVPAITATELVMIGGVEIGYDPELRGDSLHTTVILSTGLAYCYKRDTVTIYGNVVRATHGETREHVLGSGDGGRAMQSYALRQSPLTYVSAATPEGVESTLRVRVNDVLWHETDTLAGLGPRDHGYVTRTDDEAKTTVIFGNGERGARLPTGVENVKAVYRTGVGKPGNVKAGQITLLANKPLHVSRVTNPLPATGGADREGRDAARRNAPLAVMSLDRLVSVRDYEDFALTFAGIGKASAARLTDGHRQLVHLTVAGADDIPIAPESDLLKNLRLALLKFGDPYQPVEVEVRALRLLVLSARVAIHPDYLWDAVEPKVRAALLARFSFDRRELGQDAHLSEAQGAIQSVEGVVYADVEVFDALDDDLTSAGLELLGRRTRPRQRIPARLATVNPYARDRAGRIQPAQLALLSPAVPETLILEELKARS